MLLSLAVALALSSQEPETVAPVTASSDVPSGVPVEAAAPASDTGGVLTVELPFALSAQGTASRVETVLTPWGGLRIGWLNHRAGGVFLGADGALFVGLEGGGTAQVSLSKLPLLMEGRGLVGARHQMGLFGIGGYGYGGVGGGGGVVVVSAFDDTASRPFGTWTARVGGGGELSFGLAQLRLELGTGVRDGRFDLHGAVAAGARF